MTNKKVIKCDLCNKEFSKKNHLDTHKARQKPCINNKYKCKYCPGNFVSKYGLHNHMKNICVNYKEYLKIKNGIEDVKIEHDIILPHSRKGEKVNNDIKDLTLEKLEIEKREIQIEKHKIEIEKLTIEKQKIEIDIEKLELKKQRVEMEKNNDNNTGNINNTINNINSNNVNNNTLVNTNNLTIQYIMNNFTNGEPLKPLNNYNAILDCNIKGSGKLIQNNNNKRLTIKNKKIAFVEKLLTITNTRVVEFIGDIITAFYLNEDDSSLQAMWATDKSRLTFLIKFLKAETGEIIWEKDHSGQKVKSLIINPLLKYINELIIIYQKEPDMLLNPNKNIKCIEISKLITCGSMALNVMKYIAPKFVLLGGKKQEINLLLKND